MINVNIDMAEEGEYLSSRTSLLYCGSYEIVSGQGNDTRLDVVGFGRSGDQVIR
jgi:hypothetical protein